MTKDGMRPRLGVDIGGVVVSLAHEREADTSFFGSDPDRTPAVPHAMWTLWRLGRYFEGEIHFVSKAGHRIEAVTRAWVAANRLFESTGLDPTHLYFVRERSDKAVVARRIGLTHFVDDRIDVLAAMNGLQRYLFLPGRDGSRGLTPPAWCVPVAGWLDLEQRLLNAGNVSL